MPRFNKHGVASCLDFFHAFASRGYEMNTVNSEKKSVGDHFDQDTTLATDGIQVNQMERGDQLTITTTNNTYYVTVIDPEAAQVRVRGGDIFRRETIAQVAGATLKSSLKPFGIYVGYSIEFFVLSKRVRTSPVRDIRLLTQSERAA